MHVLVLGSAVGIQECAADVDDGLAVPLHAQALFFRNGGHHGSFQVFLMRVADEFLNIFRRQCARHALLAFGNGKLGAVQALVFLRNRVQVDKQAIAQLADGNGNTAGAEVVAALDKAACLAAAEQALDLALNGGVALLNLGTRLFHAFHILGFGGTGGAANAVTTGAAAQQHNLVAWSRLFAAHVIGRRCAYHRANLHALGNVARVVQLVHLTSSKANLVAIGRIARSRRGNQLALGQLAFQRFGNGNRRVARAGYAHSLVHIAAARKRVADGAAHTGCRATERLDLCRMVMGFVLEEEQPILIFSINVNGALHRAGVNLVGFVQTFKTAMSTQVLRTDGAHIHQAHGLVLALQLGTHGQVLLECQLHRFIVDLHIGKLGAEGGVAAVVRPIRVNHAHLGDSRVAADFLEMSLEELDVGLVHGKAALFAELCQARTVELREAFDNLYRLGLGNLHLKRFALLKRRLARLNRVDNVMLDSGNVRIGKRAFQHIYLRAAHSRALALAYQLDALAGRIGTLIKLARKELDGEHRLAREAFALQGGFNLGAAFACNVYLGLAEHNGNALLEQLAGNTLYVVTVDKAQAFKRFHAQNRLQLVQKLLRLNIETGLFLNINARNHESYPSVIRLGVNTCPPERETPFKTHLKQLPL